MGPLPLPWRPPTNWELGPKEKWEGERQTDGEVDIGGCVRGIKIETGGGTIRAEVRDTQRERETLEKPQRRD